MITFFLNVGGENVIRNTTLFTLEKVFCLSPDKNFWILKILMTIWPLSILITSWCYLWNYRNILSSCIFSSLSMLQFFTMSLDTFPWVFSSVNVNSGRNQACRIQCSWLLKLLQKRLWACQEYVLSFGFKLFISCVWI